MRVDQRLRRGQLAQVVDRVLPAIRGRCPRCGARGRTRAGRRGPPGGGPPGPVIQTGLTSALSSQKRMNTLVSTHATAAWVTRSSRQASQDAGGALLSCARRWLRFHSPSPAGSSSTRRAGRLPGARTCLCRSVGERRGGGHRSPSVAAGTRAWEAIHSASRRKNCPGAASGSGRLSTTAPWVPGSCGTSTQIACGRRVGQVGPRAQHGSGGRTGRAARARSAGRDACPSGASARAAVIAASTAGRLRCTSAKPGRVPGAAGRRPRPGPCPRAGRPRRPAPAWRRSAPGSRPRPCAEPAGQRLHGAVGAVGRPRRGRGTTGWPRFRQPVPGRGRRTPVAGPTGRGDRGLPGGQALGVGGAGAASGSRAPSRRRPGRARASSISWSSRGRSGSGGSAGEPGPDPVPDLVRATTGCAPAAARAPASTASVSGRSRWYSSSEPDRTASCASAAASRSSRPSLSAASEAGCPAAQARVQTSRSRCGGPRGGHQRLAGGPGLGDEVVGGPAERFRRVEQRRSVASRTIRPSRRRVAICSLTGLRPAQRLRPVQGQPQQARGDPGWLTRSPRSPRAAGRTARTALRQFVHGGDTSRSRRAPAGRSPRCVSSRSRQAGRRPTRPAGRRPAGPPGPWLRPAATAQLVLAAERVDVRDRVRAAGGPAARRDAARGRSGVGQQQLGRADRDRAGCGARPVPTRPMILGRGR